MNTLTIKDLEEAQRLIGDFRPTPNPFAFNGMPIFEVKPKIIPVLQVRKDFKWLTDEARAKIDGYLLDRFGTREECAVPKDQILICGNNIFMRPEHRSIIAGLDACA